MRNMKAKEFDSLSKRDLDNSFFRDTIRKSLKTLEELQTSMKYKVYADGKLIAEFKREDDREYFIDARKYGYKAPTFTTEDD